jgi:hypothetical protein
MRNPQATYDVLAIVGALDRSLGGVSRLEAQRFAFLACVLALYKGQPVAEWGYRFARTAFGTPFSAEVNDVLDFLFETGRLAEEDERYRITPSGETLLKSLSALSLCARRQVYLDASTGSALVIPPGIIFQGLENEPTVQGSKIRTSGATLLDGAALQFLYETFAILTEVLPTTTDDLLAPSVLWLTCLADESLSKRVEGTGC